MEDICLQSSATKICSALEEREKNPKIPQNEEDWETYRRAISSLYASRTLSEVMSQTESQHGFRATLNQYKKRIHKWNLQPKYIKDSEYHAMIRILKQRGQEFPSKRTRFEFKGKIVDPCNIARFASRAAQKSNPTNHAATDSGNRHPPGLRYWTPSSPADNTQEIPKFPFSNACASQLEPDSVPVQTPLNGEIKPGSTALPNGKNPILAESPFIFAAPPPTNKVVNLIQDLTQGSASSKEDQQSILLFHFCQRPGQRTSCNHCDALVTLRHWVCGNKAFTAAFVRLVLKLALPSLEHHPATACLIGLFASGFYFFNHMYETAARLMTPILSTIMDDDCLRNTPYEINTRMLALFITKCYVALGGRSDMFAPLVQAFDTAPKHIGEKKGESNDGNIGTIISETYQDIFDVEMGEDLNEAERNTVIATDQSSTEDILRTASEDKDCVWHWEEHQRNKYLRKRGAAALDMRMVPHDDPLERDERVPWYLKEAEFTRRLDESQVRCKVVRMEEDHSVVRIYLNFWDLLE